MPTTKKTSKGTRKKKTPAAKETRKIGKVVATHITVTKQGELTASLSFSYGGPPGVPQGIPLRVMGDVVNDRYSDALSKFVVAMLKVFAVDTWEHVAGRTCYVVLKGGQIVGLEPLPTEPGMSVMFDDLFKTKGE